MDIEISPRVMGEEKQRVMGKDQSCNFIFDVIKRNSPQPVGDITPTNRAICRCSGKRVGDGGERSNLDFDN